MHLINFTNAVHLNWRDTDGTQPVPAVISDARITVAFKGPVKKVWLASPDLQTALPVTLPFVQSGNQITFMLPQLLYWDMIVIEPAGP